MTARCGEFGDNMLKNMRMSVRWAWLPVIFGSACSSEEANLVQQPSSEVTIATTFDENSAGRSNPTAAETSLTSRDTAEPTSETRQPTNNTAEPTSDSTEPSPSGDQAAVEQFCQRRAEQICGFATGCCAVTSEGECVGTAKRGCLNTVEESLGTQVEFDAGRAEACLAAEQEAWYSEACEIHPTSSPASVEALTICTRLGRGTVAIGGSCERDAECASSEVNTLVCAPSGGSGVCTEAMMVGAGGDCSATNAVCEAGEYCALESNTCTPLRGDGQTCGSHSECLMGFCDPESKVCPELTLETLCASLEANL